MKSTIELGLATARLTEYMSEYTTTINALAVHLGQTGRIQEIAGLLASTQLWVFVFVCVSLRVCVNVCLCVGARLCMCVCVCAHLCECVMVIQLCK